MFIRIFLPETVYRVKSVDISKCYNIFGKIVKDPGTNSISIFIVDIHKRHVQATYNPQLIGMISKSASDVKHLPSDYITLKVDESKSVLEIKALELPNFISTGTRFNTQIFLYDSKIFSEISHRNDGQQWCQRQEPIAQLLFLIKNREDFSEQQHSNITRSDKNRLILFLISLSTFCETKLSFLNSSFLKHFQFWATSFEKLTHKK